MFACGENSSFSKKTGGQFIGPFKSISTRRWASIEMHDFCDPQSLIKHVTYHYENNKQFSWQILGPTKSEASNQPVTKAR